VLVTFIVYVVANVLPLATRQQLQIQEMQSFKQLQELEKEGLIAVWDPTTNRLRIYNNSTIPVKIVRVWVEKDGNVEPKLVEDMVIEPGGKEELVLDPPDLKPLRVETSRGTIVDVQKREPQYPPREPDSEPPKSPTHVLEPASFISNPNIYVDRKLIEEPTRDNIRKGKTSGMVRYFKILIERSGKIEYIEIGKRALVLEKEDTDVCVHVRGTPGIFILGYAPGTDNKLYNALLTGTEEGVKISVIDCKTGNQIYSIKLTSTGYVRAKLLGINITKFYFDYHGVPDRDTDNPSQALGYWYYYIPFRDIKIILELYGKVKKLKIYRDEELGGRDSSYEPYLLIADVDGNGVPELIFTDEDVSYGIRTKIRTRGGEMYVCSRNDRSFLPPSRWKSDDEHVKYYLLDVSTRPFRFYLKGYPIDPEKHGGVMISLRLYFHDNEDCEQKCVFESGLPILGLYLVDPGEDGELDTQDDKIVVSSEYTYEYLTGFEETYPLSQCYVTLTATLAVPENVTANKLYVAIGFNDPYKYRSNGLDDVDITLALELLGITLLPRST